MLKLIIILLIAALGIGYYMGFFTMDDSPKKMVEKVENLAKEKIGDAKDSAKKTIKESAEESLDKAKDAVK